VATAEGLETLPTVFTHELAKQLRRERGAADVIVANNVIANIDDLQELAEAVRALLAPGGVFIFESGYLADLVNNLVFDNIYHEHISYHSAKPLSLLFARHGLEMFDIVHVATKGGSIRGFVQHKGAGRAITMDVAATIAREEEQGLYRADTYRALCSRLDSLRDSLVAVLKDIRAKGQKIAGYGASHSVTTLLHHFDVAKYLDVLVDDNPRKHNLYSPGHHLPVRPSSALYEAGKPEYVVILPWRFADLIISRNTRFQQEGGKFIVPIPETRVV
jgi:hypothetical protein